MKSETTTQQGINVMMEPTVTQNSALYFAQHKNWAPRAEFFRRFRFGARKQRLARKAATMGELFFWARLRGQGQNAEPSLVFSRRGGRAGRALCF